jgi:hypothetical protein
MSGACSGTALTLGTRSSEYSLSISSGLTAGSVRPVPGGGLGGPAAQDGAGQAAARAVLDQVPLALVGELKGDVGVRMHGLSRT